jgi:hypothetical protein
MRKDYTAELESFRNKTFKMHNEIEQIAAKALGYYPAYRDDPKLFPDVSPDDDSVCIGDHTTETIVAELAERYKKVNEDRLKLITKLEELLDCELRNDLHVGIEHLLNEVRD